MRVICLENLLLRFLHKVFKILQGHKKITQLIFKREQVLLALLAIENLPFVQRFARYIMLCCT